MKITQQRLKEIIKEEMDVLRKEQAQTDMFGEPDEEGGMAKSQLFKISNYGKEIGDMLAAEDQLPAWVQAKLTKCAMLMGDVKHFLEGEMAAQSDEMAPEQEEEMNLDELESIVTEELEAVLEASKVNPWAVCTAQVGREDKDKYERCVLDVKKKQGM